MVRFLGVICSWGVMQFLFVDVTSLMLNSVEEQAILLSSLGLEKKTEDI